MKIQDGILEVLEEAIERVSEGTKAFTIRNLYYVVRDLFLKKFEDAAFYKNYKSFTQDFMPWYEKKHDPIPDMIREPRGGYVSPSDDPKFSFEKQIMTGTILLRGVGNKIVVIEKAGLWRVFKENKFEIKLDGIFMHTGGFATDAGRKLLKSAEETGLPVCIVHDYDINGILIHTTLTKQTKRRDTFIKEVIDLGINWEIIKQLMKERGLTPEPVDLTYNDIAKLEGLLKRGEVSEEEYRFLLGKKTPLYDVWKTWKAQTSRKEKSPVKPTDILAKGKRVELNALTPLELMNWLEERLEELDLWKTLPSQEKLDETLTEKIDEDLEELKSSIIGNLKDELLEATRVEKIWRLYVRMSNLIGDEVKKKVDELWEEASYPGMTVEDFEKKLREDMMQFWTRLAGTIGREMAEEQREPIGEKFEEDKEELIEQAQEKEEVKDGMKTLIEGLKKWLEEEKQE